MLHVSELARLSPGLSRVEIRAVYDGTEPNSVSIWPEELDPFGLRFSFWDAVTKEVAAELEKLEQRFPSTRLAVNPSYLLGMRRLYRENPHARRLVRAGAPTTIYPNTPDTVEWTAEYQRRLHAHMPAYELYAKEMLGGRAHRAFKARAEMIMILSDEYARAALRELPDWYLRRLLAYRNAKEAEGYTREEIAEPFPFEWRTFRRRCREAERRGLEAPDGEKR